MTPMQPTSSALHRPAFGQQYKALNILRPHYDLNDPAAGLYYPLEQRFATEGTINPNAGKDLSLKLLLLGRLSSIAYASA